MSRDLTKWPRLIVVGEPVTQEQANEILIRTQSAYLSTNDTQFAKQVTGVFGCVNVNSSFLEEATTVALGILGLEYLNNSRIVSCWIGGPHGWCDWNGHIGTSNYNIGKWPSLEEVHEEWATIAAAFPYLRLRAQLIGDEGEGQVVAQWEIAAGMATSIELEPTPLAPLEPANYLSILAPLGERGVSLERLRRAVIQVRASVYDRSRAEVHQ